MATTTSLTFASGPLYDPAAPRIEPLNKPLQLTLADGTTTTLPPLADPRLLTEDGGIPLPRRMATCIAFWRRLLPLVESPKSTARLLDGLTNGFRLPTPDWMDQFQRPNTPDATRHASFVDAEVDKYLRLGIWVPADRAELRGIMAIHVVDQAGGPRLVLVGTPFNDRTPKPDKFRYQDINHLASYIQEGDWMSKADIRRLYLNIPIHPDVQRWCGICWRGRYFKCVGLPLGISPAPRLATKVMRPIVRIMARINTRISQYLDDGIVVSRTQEENATQFQTYLQLIARSGLLPHPEKCSPAPTQDIVFLGFQVSSVLQPQHPDVQPPMLRLTPKKRASYVQQARRLMTDATHQRPVQVKKLARFTGSIVSTMAAFRPGLALLFHTSRTTASVAASNGWRATCTLSPAIKEECRAVRRLLASNHWTSTSITRRHNPDMVLTTDASQAFWGAFVSQPSSPDTPLLPPTQGQWPSTNLEHGTTPSCCRIVEFVRQQTGKEPPEWTRHAAAIVDRLARTNWIDSGLPVESRHNNELETRGLLMGLLHYASSLNGKNIVVRSDNTTALAVARRGRSAATTQLNHLGVSINMALQAMRTTVVSWSHLAGDDNTIADRASRQWIDHHRHLEWPIDATHLARVLEQLETPLPDIDAFATSANAKCRRFFSLRPDPLAEATDAMVQPWTGRSLLINSPFHLMQQVVDKLLDEPPSHAVVIAPHWPNQRWFHQLNQVATHSVLVPPQAILDGPNATPALANPVWRIRAWRL